MVQGTTSDAGKSTLVAALCRILARRGIKVAPFKPQNMALNSAVTADGGEIGRAQALQAQAAFLAPHTDMNPVLIKPTSDKDAQIIIHGRAVMDMNARDYHTYKTTAMKAVLESYTRLQTLYDVIIVEGAGSPAEINLRDRDIANMGFAEAVDCPVILIADIDKGGVFAHLVGTLELLSLSEKNRVKGFVINKFRGDLSLLTPGVDWLKDYTKKNVYGVLPYIQGLYLDAEDALSTQQIKNQSSQLKVIVPAVPRISNHTDFDPLRLHPQIDFHYIGPDQAIPQADLIVLPGSKNVRADLQWLRNKGWEQALCKHLRYGGKVIGICGGMQMLGKCITDPYGVEGVPGEITGFNLLDFVTELKPHKQLKNVQGRLFVNNAQVTGYEIHAGVTIGAALNTPAVTLENGNDGAISADGQILTTYIHGIFDQPEALQGLLQWAGAGIVEALDIQQIRENALNRLADIVEENMDVSALFV